MANRILTQHYAQLIGLASPWRVTAVESDHEAKEVVIRVERGQSARLRCPECNRVCRGYDARERRWRHLDTMQYRTILVAQVPRVDCGEHGVRQVAIPWSDPGSLFTSIFEALVIDWLLEAVPVIPDDQAKPGYFGKLFGRTRKTTVK